MRFVACIGAMHYDRHYEEERCLKGQVPLAVAEAGTEFQVNS